jgi:hypothetical protein
MFRGFMHIVIFLVEKVKIFPVLYNNISYIIYNIINISPPQGHTPCRLECVLLRLHNRMCNRMCSFTPLQGSRPVSIKNGLRQRRSGVTVVSNETHYSVKRDLRMGSTVSKETYVWGVQCQKRPTYGEYSVKRDLRMGSTVSKETYVWGELSFHKWATPKTM